MSRTKSHAVELLLTRDQCRAADRYAIEQLGIPGVMLMENAGRNAADVVERLLLKNYLTTKGGMGQLLLTRGKDRVNTGQQVGPCHPAANKSGGPAQVAIVCGKGNNGGDGFVIARHLSLRGHEVSVDLFGNPADLTGDAATNHVIADRMSIPIRRLDEPRAPARAAQRWRSCAVVVDALLGTGFAGEVREPLAGVIRQINALRVPPETPKSHRRDAGTTRVSGCADKVPMIVAVDVPSGLDADTGQAGGVAVRADYTVTFLAAKVGLVKPSARPYVGRLIVADIGAPLALIARRLRFR
jgi:NAD(P)H-hydrate epimerase